MKPLSVLTLVFLFFLASCDQPRDRRTAYRSKGLNNNEGASHITIMTIMERVDLIQEQTVRVERMVATGHLVTLEIMEETRRIFQTVQPKFHGVQMVQQASIKLITTLVPTLFVEIRRQTPMFIFNFKHRSLILNFV